MSAISLFSVLLPFLLSIPTPTGALLHATAICGGHNFIEHQTQNETWQIVTTVSVCGGTAAHSSERQSWVNMVNAFKPWHLKDPSKIAHCLLL